MENAGLSLLYESPKPQLVFRLLAFALSLGMIGLLIIGFYQDYQFAQIIGTELYRRPQYFLVTFLKVVTLLPFSLFLLLVCFARTRVYADKTAMRLVVRSTYFWERQSAVIPVANIKEIQVCLKHPGNRFLWFVQVLKNDSDDVIVLAQSHERLAAELIASEISEVFGKVPKVTIDKPLIDAGISIVT